MTARLVWLSRFVALFGVVCCAIALAHIAIGPRAIVDAVPVNATMDGEDRFYATLFLGFGAALVWCSRKLRERSGVFGSLLLVFFLGGVARGLSLLLVGWPHPLFVFLGGLELILPPLLWLSLRAAARVKSG